MLNAHSAGDMSAYGVSEVAKNWAEVVAIFLGGIWAVYRFAYEARSNTPSLDGDLTIERNTLSNVLDVVTVRARWNNRSKFALGLNNEKCLVSAYKLSDTSPNGKLEKKEHLHTQRVFSEPTVLEPKTESNLRVHFVLSKGPVYFFRWELESNPYRKWYFFKKGAYTWSKEIVWNSVS